MRIVTEDLRNPVSGVFNYPTRDNIQGPVNRDRERGTDVRGNGVFSCRRIVCHPQIIDNLFMCLLIYHSLRHPLFVSFVRSQGSGQMVVEHPHSL